VTVVELTSEGHRHAQQFIDILNARLEPLFADWSTARQKAAAEILDLLALTLEEAQVPAGRRVGA
ncbi:MAG TPA: hypothetical protein VFY84_16180, partial [Jiangellales bacterium]|nr:hypothetical protein [Jiangellales bacterium]